MQKPLKFINYGIAAAVGWTVCVVLLYSWDKYNVRIESLEIARVEARIALNKDIHYRRWNAMNKGIYVPASEQTPPNPYLSNIPNRDIIAPGGQMYTLVNPAYMTRLVSELQKAQRDAFSRITSLKPLRPENLPDDWEKMALNSFESGVKEYSSVETVFGKPYMRLMVPLFVEPECLKCHAIQGYHVGDVRGGLNVAIPMEPIQAVFEMLNVRKFIGYLVMWAAGVAMISLGVKRLAVHSKAVQKSEETLSSITAAARDAIVMADDKGIVTFWNPAAGEMFGYSKDEAVGSDLYQLIVPRQFLSDFIDTFKEFQKTGRLKSGRMLEFTAVKKSGVEFPVELSISFVELDRRQYCVGILRDITVRKHAENEVRRAREQAEAASRAKSEFLANMSHELRTPMNGIIGMADLALKSGASGEQKEYIEVINQSAEALYSILNDILDFSKIEAGKLELEQIDFPLETLLEGVVKTLSLQAHRKGLELNLMVHKGSPAWLNGDPVRLRQVLMNLVGNAIKFTEDGEVALSVSPAGPGLTFAVKDTGIGIPQDKIKDIFESFQQADNSTTRRYGGTGLGLAISRKLVEIMGGDINVESSVGKGSTFSFSLNFPAPKEYLEPDRLYNDSCASIDGANVLIVSCNDNLRAIASSMAADCGANVFQSSDALSALGILNRLAEDGGCGIDVAVIDSRLKTVDGFQLAANIKAIPAFSSVKAIIMVDMNMLSTGGFGRDTAGARLLSKPVLKKSFIEALSAELGAKAARAHLRQTDMVSSIETPSIGKAEAPVACATSEAGLRVLLAEDNAINRKLAVRILEKAGHHVRVVENGAEALALLKTDNRFDMVLLDVHMPEIDGLEVSRTIRSGLGIAVKSNIPIIAITARVMSTDIKECFDAGMDGYVAKPLKAKDLLDAIAKLGTKSV